MSKKIKVTKSDPPETTEILAEAIVKISDSMNSLVKSGLNEKAIILLIQGQPGVTLSRSDIKDVLDGLKQLKGFYCRKGS